MNVKMIHENKGKSLLIAGIILMWVVLGILFKFYGYGETWKLWHVPVHPPVFRDFLLIPGSAESFRHGFEPAVENPYDVAKRIFNYPAFWRLFFYTNITADDTIWIVVTLLVLYSIAIMVFPQNLTITGAVMMLLVVFSPASMLLYERGNADIFVFPICVAIILLSEYSTTWTAAMIVFGAIVKMFPLLGITVFLRENRQTFWRLAIICALVMVAYGALTFSSQDAAWNTTMRGDGISYGSFVLITRLGDYLLELLPANITFGMLEIFFEGFALILILLPVIFAVRSNEVFSTGSQRNLAAFRMGASIYVGTFLLGNNWDYRLAFLVLVIPQLVEWLSAGNKKYKRLTYAVMALLMLTCWHFVLGIDLPIIPLKDRVNRIVIVDEVINWMLLPGLTYLLAASLPDWMLFDLRKIIGSRKTTS